jgi:hypothetical protein
MIGFTAGRHRFALPALATAAAGLAAVAMGTVGTGVAAATPANCTPNVDGSGLSAAVVASTGQSITDRTIDATGCDIGIYVGDGVSDVEIRSVTVENANFQGIFAQNASYVTIEHSTVTNNAFNTIDPYAPALPSGVSSDVSQAFAISLFGVSHSTVADNTVYNNGRGGIGIMDNGPNDPGILAQDQNRSAPLVSSSYDTVTGNREWANYNGCGIVAATQNFGGSLSHLEIAGNRIFGTQSSPAQIGASGADVGGIVVAADPPNSSVTEVTVEGNDVTNSFEGGLVVNAEAFNSFTQDVYVVGNRVSGNNWGHQEAPDTAGIIVYENPAAVRLGQVAPRNINTVVARNLAWNQFYGIWATGHDAPLLLGNHIWVTSGGTPVAIG